MTDQQVYLLPGRGNRLSDLGAMIASRGGAVRGRELRGPFARLRFPEQLELIATDLGSDHWHDRARLVGHSFGAYLLLHALAGMPPFPGRILLLSPALGAAIDRRHLAASFPPRSGRLLGLAEAHRYPLPARLEIHTGQEDTGCDPRLAGTLAELLGARLHLVAGQGHSLASAYVESALTAFLAAP